LIAYRYQLTAALSGRRVNWPLCYLAVVLPVARQCRRLRATVVVFLKGSVGLSAPKGGAW